MQAAMETEEGQEWATDHQDSPRPTTSACEQVTLSQVSLSQKSQSVVLLRAVKR